MSARTLGLALALVLFPGGFASAQCTKSVLECIEDRWTNVELWDGTNPQDSVHWSVKIAAVEWDLDSNAGCARVKAEAESAFSTITWYTGTPKSSITGTWVEGSGEKDGIILDEWYILGDYDENIKLDLILHEVAHAADFDHAPGEEFGWWPEACGKMPENEEEVDPTDPAGGGDPEEPEQPCEPVWVPPVTETRTVRVPVGRSYEDCTGMEWDDKLGWICEGATLVGGRYYEIKVEIELEPGYWTVCPANET